MDIETDPATPHTEVMIIDYSFVYEWWCILCGLRFVHNLSYLAFTEHNTKHVFKSTKKLIASIFIAFKIHDDANHPTQPVLLVTFDTCHTIWISALQGSLIKRTDAYTTRTKNEIFANNYSTSDCSLWHDDVIKWKHFQRYWPFVRGIHRSPVNSPHKGQWRGALIFSLICVWINGWVNNSEAGDLRHHRAHYDVIVMNFASLLFKQNCEPVSWKKPHIYFKSNIPDNKVYEAPCWPRELCYLGYVYRSQIFLLKQSIIIRCIV